MLRVPTTIVPRLRSRRATLIAVLSCLGVLAVAATATAVGTTSVITLSNDSFAMGVAFSPDGERAYVTNEGGNRVAVIDTAMSTVTGYISSNGSCTSDTPRGVATTEDRVFVASSQNDRVCVIDQASNAYIASIAIPDSIANTTDPKLVAIDQTANVGYVLANDPSISTDPGRVTRFDTTPPYSVGSTVVTIAAAQGLALSVDGSELYVSTLDGRIVVIATATMTVTRTITVSGGEFVSLVADPRGEYLIVFNNHASGSTPSSVDIVRIADGQLVGSVALGTNVSRYDYNQIAVSPDGRTAYVAEYWFDELWEVSVADPSNPQLASGTPMTITSDPRGVAVSPDGARVYVTMATRPAAKVTAITMATPGAPTGAQATAGVESATVTWSAPSSDGGAPVLSYTVTAVEDPAKSCTSTATLPAAPALTCTVSGLTAGSSYSFVVKARNGMGEGSASAASNAVVARARAAADSGSAAADSGSAATPSKRSTVRVVSAGQASRSVVLRVRVSGPGRVTVAGTVAPSKDGGARQRVCSGTRAVKRAGTVLVTCRLNQTGRALLVASSLRVGLGVAYRPVEGAARTATRVVRLVQTGGQPEPVTG